MFYILLNSLGLVAVGSLGRLLKNRINQGQIDALYNIVGTLVLVIALQGALEIESYMVITMSVFLGTLIGSYLAIEDRIKAKAASLIKKGSSQFINGIISVSLITCMGSLAILGPLNIALKNDPTLMNFKSLLDTVFALVFGTVYGASIYPASLVLLAYQGFFYLIGLGLAPFLTDLVIGQIGQVGSLILIILGLNMLKITDIKLMDLTPSLVFPLVFYGLRLALGF